MGQTQGNFERATLRGATTLRRLAAQGEAPLELGFTHKRVLLDMLNDLDQIAAAIRAELMSRA